MHKPRKLFAAIGLLATLWAVAQPKTQPPTTGPNPRFEDYPVTQIFKGTPAVPILETAQQKRFRTRIQEGVKSGGELVREGKVQPGPNFAGHYVVAEWACGSPCLMMAVVDALTGKVYNPPMAVDLMLPHLGGGPFAAEVEFRQNSSLMVMEPQPDLAAGPIYTHYFVWKNNEWTLLRKVPRGRGETQE